MDISKITPEIKELLKDFSEYMYIGLGGSSIDETDKQDFVDRFIFVNSGFDFPNFVSVKDIALRLTYDSYGKPIYYRDAGDWETHIKIVDNKIYADCEFISDDIEFVEITKDEWSDNNNGEILDEDIIDYSNDLPF